MTNPYRRGKLDAMSKDLEQARRRLKQDSLAFVLVKNGTVLGSGTKPGVHELLGTVRALGTSTHGAVLADRVVGKAVAMIARHAQLSQVYSPLMSEACLATLALTPIVVEYDRLIPLILNRNGNGPCPMEMLTGPFDEPEPALQALEAFFSSLSRPA